MCIRDRAIAGHRADPLAERLHFHIVPAQRAKLAIGGNQGAIACLLYTSGNRDPWSGGGRDQGPPDLDEVIRKLSDKFGALLGRCV